MSPQLLWLSCDEICTSGIELLQNSLRQQSAKQEAIIPTYHPTRQQQSKGVEENPHTSLIVSRTPDHLTL
jgi:hypothetical protein